MARFRGTVHGQAGEASRIGSPRSGLETRTNGWDVGVYVEARANGSVDEMHVFATGGSNGGASKLIAVVREGVITFPDGREVTF